MLCGPDRRNPDFQCNADRMPVRSKLVATGAALTLWVAIALWIVLSVNFIPLAGVQNDEALFASPLYQIQNQDVPAPIWQRRVPVMVMSYLGALKAFLYAPVLGLFGASIWTISS